MAKEEVGRNAPCPCGSGKKYKKCHGPVEADLRRGKVPQPVLEWVKRTQDERRNLENRGIYVNYVKPVLFQGKKVWMLGTGIMLTDNLTQTFHEFITAVLIDTLGRDWWEEQLRLPDEQRHFVPSCFLRLREWQRVMAGQAEEVRPGVMAADADGLVTYFLNLAFDVTTMRQVLNLPAHLVARLRHRDQYQGARYELAVASMLARIDCEITFLDSPGDSSKHPEFVARFRPTGSSFAVEVKSRHRAGVIHTPGDVDQTKIMRADVGRHLKDALDQNPGDMPFLVFIDLNSPLTSEGKPLDKAWIDDMKTVLDEFDVPTAEIPDR